MDIHEEEAMFAILDEIGAERHAQDAKWGQQNHPWKVSHQHFTWSGMQSAGQAKDMVDFLAQHGELDYAGILAEEFYEALEARSRDEVRAELLQVAAVAVAAIESLDRNGR